MRNHYDDTPVSTLRRKLLLGLPCGLVTAGPLALAGCGGGGSDGGAEDTAATAMPLTLPPYTVTTQAIKVNLPAGSGVTPDATHVMTAQNVSAVAADGTAGVLQFDAAPQMTYVFDAAGRMLLIGFIGDGATTLDAHSSAEALIYMTSRVEHQLPALQIALRQVLRTHPVVDPLAAAVAAAASRAGIASDDAGLMAALQAAVAQLLGPPPAAGTGRASAQSLRIVPGTTQSGITITEPGAFNTIAVRNDFRRRAYAFVQRTGDLDADGNLISLPSPEALNAFDVSATTPLSLDNLVIAVGDLLVGLAANIGVVGSYVYSQFPWTPSLSQAQFMPLNPGTAKKSIYTVRVVGPGAIGDATMTDAESAKFDELITATVFDDIVVPIVSTLILPAIGNKAGASYATNFKALLASLLTIDLAKIDVQRTYLRNTSTAIRNGDFSTAIIEFGREFFTSGVFGELLKQGIIALTDAVSSTALSVTDGSGNKVIVAIRRNLETVAEMVSALKTLSIVKEITEKVTAAADLVAIAKDLLAAKTLESFEVDAYSLKVTLSPAAAELKIGAGLQRFTATIDPGTSGESADPAAYIYEWICDGTWGDLGFGPDLGTDFKTSSNLVDFVPNGTAVGGDVVNITVHALRLNATDGGAGNSVAGTATATLTFAKLYTLQITPDSDAATDGSIGVTALINETLPQTATVTWQWTQSGVGSIVALPPDANLQDSAVTFNAGSIEGTATVTATATIVNAGSPTVVTDPATTMLTVRKGLNTVTVHGNFACDAWLGTDQFYVRAFVVIPKVANALTYDMTANNFFDPYYFGSSIHTVIPADGMYQGRPDFADAYGSPTNQDRGGSIWNGLADIFGNSQTAANDMASAVVDMGKRFAGMQVTAVVTLKS